ncbi:hypothetical protein FGO68_gene12330 [Halteria grandinella]|uniref:Uncharacterized protein n=1 Tax=Halteria grandinella TaxID=5974 RepID=A0A8J8NQI8_HALGN|nr:hypothetical protein FGO68_gene12330 [Halteria grandinella]
MKTPIYSKIMDQNYTADTTIPLDGSGTGVAIFYKKSLEFPPSMMDILGIIFLLGMSFLANAGGLGGGGLLTPFMMIFLKLSIFECVPVANFFGWLAAATRFVVNYRQKHPNPLKAADGKVSLEYEIVTLAMPLLYLGTLFGVQIGTQLSETQLAISLSSVMFFVTYKTTQKAIKMYKEEKAGKDAQQIQMTTIISKETEQQTQNILLVDIIQPEIQKQITYSTELQQIVDNEAKHFPPKRVIKYLITLAMLFITSMCMGTKYQQKRLVDPYVSYVILAIFIIYTVISTFFNCKELRRIHMVKRRDGYVYDKADITFEDNKSLAFVVLNCFIAGMLGGIVGIAGGIILGPLFLQMGMLPVVVAATNQYLALISTTSVTSQFIQVNRLVKITGKQSIIVFTLALVLGISFIALPLKYLIQ